LSSLQAQFKHNIILQSLGEVTVLYNESELHQVEHEILPSMRELGLKGRLIDCEGIRNYIPEYNPDGAVGAFITKETFVVHPDALLMGLIEVLRKRKVPVIEYARVSNLALDGKSVYGVLIDEEVIKAKRVILCCGTAGKDFLAGVGWLTPLEIRRHQTIVIDNIWNLGWPVIRWTGPISSGSCHRTARGEVLAACQHPEGDHVNNNQTSMDFILRTAEQLCSHLPVLSGGSILRQWGGVTSNAPDDLPYAGPVPDRQGLWALYGINGFTIYPLLADYLSLSLLGIKTEPIMSHFSLSAERGVEPVL
jgi:glycine/D-amino acid oxidase-like deaminating enzyme